MEDHIVGDSFEDLEPDQVFGALFRLNTQSVTGGFHEISSDTIAKLHEAKAIAVVAADHVLALTLLRPPGEMGADVAVGSSRSVSECP